MPGTWTHCTNSMPGTCTHYGLIQCWVMHILCTAWFNVLANWSLNFEILILYLNYIKMTTAVLTTNFVTKWSTCGLWNHEKYQPPVFHFLFVWLKMGACCVTWSHLANGCPWPTQWSRLKWPQRPRVKWLQWTILQVCHPQVAAPPRGFHALDTVAVASSCHTNRFLVNQSLTGKQKKFWINRATGKWKICCRFLVEWQMFMNRCTPHHISAIIPHNWRISREL